MAPNGEAIYKMTMGFHVSLFLLYVTAGRLGLLFAVPPGFATALWLPSGIALVAMLSRGRPVLGTVFLASASVNLWVILEQPTAAPLAVRVLLPLCIAGGSTLQAYLAWRLGKRHQHTITGTIAPRPLLRFICLVVPLACLVGPTVGVAALRFLSGMDGTQVLHSWVTWWIGDCLGVLMVLPLYIAAHGNLRAMISRRTLFIAVPLLLSLATSVVYFERSNTYQQHSNEEDFRSRVAAAREAFSYGINRYGDGLYALRSYLSLLPVVDQHSFQSLATNMLPRYHGLQGLAWVERVPFGDKAAYEGRVRREDGQDFAISENLPRSTSVEPQQLQGAHAVVRYIEPLMTNVRARGFDIGSEAHRRDALARALRLDRVAATEPVALVQRSAERDGMLLVLPVYAPDRQLRGFIVGVFSIAEMLEFVIGPAIRQGLATAVHTSGPEPALVYAGPEKPGVMEKPQAASFQAQSTIDGLNWTFSFSPSTSYQVRHRSLYAWSSLAMGLLFSAVMGMFLAVLNGRKEALAQEVGRRKVIERRLEQNALSLEQARHAAEAANQAKSAFLANMSHEIRTPLGAVLGFAELISNPQLTATERQDYLAAMRRNGDLLSSIINDILDLSQVEAGKVQLDKTMTPLADTLTDVTTFLKLRAREKGIALHLLCAGPVPAVVYTDALRLRQILINIVGNAIKFTDRGTVTVTMRQDGSPEAKLLFDIKDTGTGISSEQAAKLFMPFSQADASTKRTFGGTGLGLVLARRMAELLGGTVELVESEPGRGSVFRLAIDVGPMHELLAVGLYGAGEEQPVPAPAAAGPGQAPIRIDGLRVLLVDDASDNQLLVGRLLKGAGAVVDTADNGQIAVAKALRENYDVVLMDLQMPVMDGYEALAALRHGGYTKPILALTAHALKEERARCLAAGFDDHLSKPIDRRILLSALLPFHAERGSRTT